MNPTVTLTVATPERINRWRPFVQWFLAIPHFFVLWILTMVSSVVAFLSFFAVLFTTRIPEGLYSAQVMVLRYQQRVGAYANFLVTDYPPYAFDAVTADPGGYPVALSIDPQPESMSRLLPLVKWLLALPNAIALVFVAWAAGIAMFFAFFAVVFTGKYPEGIQRFVVGVQRWSLRLSAYVYLLTDDYPPFSLQ